jgi:hypothetical protein
MNPNESCGIDGFIIQSCPAVFQALSLKLDSCVNIRQRSPVHRLDIQVSPAIVRFT